MKATLGDTVIAEAPDEDIIRIEGNAYFPPQSVKTDLLAESDTPYTCPWKGAAQYWDVVTPAGTTSDGAWSYPDLKPSAVERVVALAR